MTEEKRSHSRLAVNFPTKWSGSSSAIGSRVEDVSLGGCFVNTLAMVQTDEVIGLEFRLPSGRWVQVAGKIVSYQPGIGFGVQFTGLPHQQFVTQWLEDKAH
jgi:hypothetical protein